MHTFPVAPDHSGALSAREQFPNQLQGCFVVSSEQNPILRRPKLGCCPDRVLIVGCRISRSTSATAPEMESTIEL